MCGRLLEKKDKLISDVLPWTPSHGQTKVGRPAGNYKYNSSVLIGCSLEDFPGVMDNRDVWWERVKEIHASSTTWWKWKYYNFYKGSTIRHLHIRIKEHLNTRASSFHKHLIKSKNNDNNFSIKIEAIVHYVGNLRIKEAFFNT